MNQHLELFAALAAHFEPDEVRTRPQGGRQLQYITARTVMNRLDDVLGPANWWDEYVPLEHSVICRLTVRLPDGTTLTKSDAGGYAGMPDSGDDDKSGFSDAFKRAAVKFGIGRYLYRDGVPRFVMEHLNLPALAGELSQTSHPPGQTTQSESTAPRPAGDGHSTPQTGKALFAWIKQQDEKHGFGLLEIISDWARSRDFPARMIQWSSEQVHLGHAEACAAIQASLNPRVDQQQPRRESREGRDPANDPAPSAAAKSERPGTSPRSNDGGRKDREVSQPRSPRNR
jgi:hypothetical protein